MDQLTSRQISEWEAYDRLDPIGTWREDFRVAQLLSMMLNIVNNIYAQKGHTPKNLTPLDFMPDWSGDGRYQEPKKQSVEEMKQVMLALASTQNKKVKQNNRPPIKKKKP